MNLTPTSAYRFSSIQITYPPVTTLSLPISMYPTLSMYPYKFLNLISVSEILLFGIKLIILVILSIELAIHQQPLSYPKGTC
jgi:hypothetical protein